MEKKSLAMAELWCEMVIVVLGIVYLSCGTSGSSGKTSSFVRSQWPSEDIPLDNQVFAVPKGLNAPQQVRLSASLIFACS